MKYFDDILVSSINYISRIGSRTVYHELFNDDENCQCKKGLHYCTLSRVGILHITLSVLPFKNIEEKLINQ